MSLLFQFEQQSNIQNNASNLGVKTLRNDNKTHTKTMISIRFPGETGRSIW
jgi:hypothetical protein